MNSRKKGTVALLILLLYASPPVICTQPVDTSNETPRVGLVLSGGAAKDMAHIGVLKVLEEISMPLDYIGGTSMGAIIGAFAVDELGLS